MIAALLSILIFLPIGASLAVTFLPGEYKVYRFIALGTALLQLIIALSLYLNFVSVESDYSLSAFQFVEKIEWFNMSVAGFGIISADYFLGIDGLGLSMVLLSVIVLVLATVSSWHYKEIAK